MDTKDQAFDQLVSDIQSAIGGGSAAGWHPINCPMCNNRTEDKPKGGFKFEAEQIGYNCFKGKCTASTVYTKGEPVPKKFKELMETLSVTIPLALKRYRRKAPALMEKVDDRFEKNFFEDVDFPKGFSRDVPDYWIDKLIERNVIYPDLDFQYVEKGDYEGSLVIPHYFHDKLIGWDYWTPSGNYITDADSNENMIFLPGKTVPAVVFLVEGLFDALCFPNTVAVKKSKVTAKQAYHLRNARVIVIPDRRGSKLYESAKHFGWEVCIPMWKEKDLSEAVANKGLFIAAKMVHNGTMEVGPKARVMYKRWVSL